MLDENRARLALDINTIAAINEELARLDDGQQPLEKLHGQLTIEIVKGRFQRIEAGRSRLLIDQRRTA